MDILPFRDDAGAAANSAATRTLASKSRASKSSPIFPGLDAVRAFAALGVVLLHACVPYLRYPMPGLAWPVRDTPSDLIDGLFWSIELFIMPVFLVMAGFFAWQTLSRRGPSALVRSRASRLLKPLLFGLMVVLPMDLYAWILGWVGEGLVPIEKLKSLKIASPLGDDLWGLSHLWFLQYLFLYVVILAGCFLARNRFPRLQTIRFGGSATAVTLVLIAIVTLTVRPEVVWGFQHAFAPVPSKWIYSGTFFVGGLALAIHDPNWLALRRNAGRLVAPAVIFCLAAIAMGRWHLSGGQSNLASTMLASTLLAATSVAAAWTITLAFLAYAVRIRSISASVRYLAAASFWVYLVHHPILGIVHQDIKWLIPQAGPVSKTLIAFLVTTGTCVLSYEAVVRQTRLGRWLGFDWAFPRQTVNERIDEATEHGDFQHADELATPVRRAA